MPHFDVIIGMDVLSPLRASIQCHEKQVAIPLENGETLIVEGHRRGSKLNIISCSKASKYLLGDCHAILAHVIQELRKSDSKMSPSFEIFLKYFPKNYLVSLRRDKLNSKSILFPVPHLSLEHRIV